ncbi:MAG: ClpP-like prohead protease/major capsid protein fusion protein [Sterolibacterium sp.]|jgi:ATP-dependent protease ClpP protease subunit
MKQTPQWYSIRARAAEPRAAEVFIYGDIGDSYWAETITAANFCKEIAALDVDQITVRINSVGGSVPDGLAIHNAIKRHKASVTTSIDGMALSIASLIAMAGDTVEMADNAMLMIHAPWTGIYGNSVQLRDQADVLDKWAEAMSTSYAAKTGKPAADMLALLTDGVDHYYTAAEAEAEGFVDAVIDALPIAASGVVPQASLSRFRSLPGNQAAGIPAAAAAITQEKSMSKEETLAAGQATAAHQAEITAAAAAATTAALVADKQRRTDIEGAFAKFSQAEGIQAVLKTCLDDHACTVETANAKLLAHLGASSTPIAGNHVVTLEDETDKFRVAATSALVVRAGFSTAEQRAAVRANPYRGYTLLDLARNCLARAGIKTDGMDKMQLVAAAFTQSTSDFPVLLESTMHKVLQNAYGKAALTWNRFCAIGSVSDFRAHNRYRTGSFGVLDSVGQNGEFKNKSIPDGEKASITAGTKGNIINLNRQMVINDDLGAFVGLANSLGGAAARTVEVAVYALLAENSGLGPTMSDTHPLFDAAHSNVGSSAALAMAAIDADRVIMASQKDVSGNDYLSLTPSVLLVPIGLGGTARSVNGAQYDPDTANKLQKPNIVNGLFSDIVDTPRLTGNRRYLFADPSIAPVLEVAFLDGQQEPYLEMQDGFDVDGTRYKVRLDYGTAAVDYRGAVTNAGG